MDPRVATVWAAAFADLVESPAEEVCPFCASFHGEAASQCHAKRLSKTGRSGEKVLRLVERTFEESSGTATAGFRDAGADLSDMDQEVEAWPESALEFSHGQAILKVDVASSQGLKPRGIDATYRHALFYLRLTGW